MWGKDDYFGRWVQAICGLLALACGFALLHFALTGNSDERDLWHDRYGLWAGSFACFAFAARLLWYAITGRDNINRDNF